MILPYWVSFALMLLALAVMLGGNVIWKNDRDARLISQASGLVLMALGLLSSGLRSFERGRLRLNDAVATLSQAGVSDEARSRAIDSASWNLADLREDALFLGACFFFLGIAVAHLGTTIWQPTPSSDPTQTGTPA